MRPGSALRALRPRQWIKNLALFAPLLFAGKAFLPSAVLRATVAFGAFSLVASGVYVFNDWRDREQDRLHPEKKRRPIAAGEIGLGGAVALTIACVGAGLVLAAWLGRDFTAIVGGYLSLQLLYTLWLKQVVLVDVMLIAVGFVLRVIAGSVAISVPVSNWLFLCTMLLALFLGFGKRRQELSALKGDATSHRAALSHYSTGLLDQLTAITAAACIVGYGLYAVSAETVARIGSDGLKYTVPFVIFGIFRYLYLVHQRGLGGSPERVLLSDGPLLVDVALFTLLCGAILY